MHDAFDGRWGASKRQGRLRKLLRSRRLVSWIRGPFDCSCDCLIELPPADSWSNGGSRRGSTALTEEDAFSKSPPKICPLAACVLHDQASIFTES